MIYSDFEEHRISGKNPIYGSMTVQGSKNSLLPILAATLLRPGGIVLQKVPQISDKDAFLKIHDYLGSTVSENHTSLRIDTITTKNLPIPPKLMAKTRGAFLSLGAMLARFGSVGFSMPGGCMLGKRPIDFHIAALQKMGVHFESAAADEMRASCDRLNGTEITLPFPSVGATENILLAAAAADGKTVLHNAAIEPEVCELVRFLQLRGFELHHSGVREFTVIGHPELTNQPLTTVYTLSPDRIAAATYLCAAGATGGELTLNNLQSKDILEAIPLYLRSGCEITDTAAGLQLKAPKQLSGIGQVITAPYPDFATDMQPLFIAMLTGAKGRSSFTETVFENRFSHCAQLIQMGAQISIHGKTAEIRQGAQLYGRDLLAADLRGGAALAIAALSAEGESILHDPGYIARGYDDLFGNLRRLHAQCY